MIAEHVSAYLALKTKRAQLEKYCKQLKESEDALKVQILATLDASGLESVKENVQVDDVSQSVTVYKSHTIRAEVTDHNLLQEKMFSLMNEAKAKGVPLCDAMLYQRTAAKNNILELLQRQLNIPASEAVDVHSDAVINAAAAMGIKLVDVVDVSIRKK